MRGRTATIALLATAGVVFTPVASAQSSGFALDRTEYEPGAAVHVGASIYSGCQSSQVTSPGFVAPIDLKTVGGNFPTLSGEGKTVTTPGTYTAQATCRGEVFTRTFTVKGPHPVQFSFDLDEEEYAPGAEIRISAVYLSGRCTTVANSPGFVAPIFLGKDPGHGPKLSGKGQAVTTPGSYVAQVECEGVAPITRAFRIKGPDAGPGPTSKPKPKIVKPKGAPETGGGA